MIAWPWSIRGSSWRGTFSLAPQARQAAWRRADAGRPAHFAQVRDSEVVSLHERGYVRGGDLRVPVPVARSG